MQILKKRLIPTVTALAVAFLALFGFMPQTARAEDTWTAAGDFLVSGSGYVYANGVLTINTDGANLKVKNADPNTPTTDRIVVETKAKIYLCGVNIDVSSKDNESAFMIADNVTEQVDIYPTNNKNILKSGKNCAGLQKNGSGFLYIKGDNSHAIMLEATGGDYGAGIGGGNGKKSPYIYIQYSVVIARGGKGAAGIGGGYKGSSSNIIIENSIVTAIGGTEAGKGGAGIGGGAEAKGENIIISDGSVKAVAGKGANDIGNGAGMGNATPTNGTGEKVYLLPINNPNKEEIYVDGTRYSSLNHSAIDPDDEVCYAYLRGESHTISFGSTEFKCFFDSAKNTLYTYGSDFEITTVSGTPVYGTDYIYRSDDGILKILKANSYIIKNRNPNTPTTDTIVVSKDTAAVITLAGVNVDVSGIDNACAFKIEDGNSNSVTLNLAKDTENFLKSGYGCAGLQKNGGGLLTIEGEGSLEATGGNGAAGIGGAGIVGVLNGDSSNIIITNGTITAKGGKTGAGIGGGFMGDSSKITISGGTVIANGGENGAGIGGGYMSVGSDITISGGTVTAEGGENGAGIGGGYGGEGSNIIISGGSVKAVAGENANDIGGGESKSAVTPKDEDGNTVYLCVIDNPNSETVKIYSIPYTPNNHTAADSTDTNLYAYLTGDKQIVEVGTKHSTHYHLDNAKGVFVEGIPTTTFNHNELMHWLTCSTEGCNYKMFSAGPHSGGTATCVSKKKCEICGADYGNIDSTNHAHISTEWSKDGISHWHVCLDCNARLDETAHSGGTATCASKKQCEICGAEYGEINSTNHANLSTDWSTDGTNHWHECLDCGEQVDKAAHVSSGAATPDKAEVCTVCGYEIAPALGFVAAPVISPNGGQFGATQAVTITCATDGAEIYYTTDGTIPTTASTKYTGAFTINATTTVKAIAVKSGMGDSAVTTAAFTKKSSSGAYNPSKPSRPSNPNDGNPSINDTQKSWAEIAADIAKLPNGETVVIYLNGNTTVPSEVIGAIKQVNAKAEFVVDSTRSWLVDGAKIIAISAADLSILPGNADKSALRGVTGADIKVNDTGVPADLKLTFRREFAGQFANLYKLTDGKLVFQNCVKVDENGIAVISGADENGEYVVMVCEFSDRPGDMNNDGVMNALDASAILKSVIGAETGANPLMADFNGDGAVNVLDASAILKWIIAA